MNRLIVCTLLLAQASAALAEDAPKGGIPEPSIATSLPGNGDIGGHRARLADKGITYGVNAIGEVWSNTGGVSRATVGNGRLEAWIGADLQTLLGWRGATARVNGFYIQNTVRQDETGQYGMSSRHIQNLMAISNVEALPVSRLFEAWIEQQIAGEAVTLRIGQLVADSEFVISEYAGQFINGTFGWPLIGAANLISSGPAYPLATPGARLKLEVPDRMGFMLALFNGDPAGGGLEEDPQRRNRHGLRWGFKDKPFLIGEGAVKWNAEKSATGLPGTLKLGAWHHFGAFEDQRFGSDGLSLAVSAEEPARRNGSSTFYMVLDQQLVRFGDDSGVGAFFRVATAPDDRSLIDLNVDLGLKGWGFVPGRPKDSMGIALSHGRISGRARALDRDVNAETGIDAPVRDHETALEINYLAQIVPGFSIQPVLQHIWHPGGRVPDPNDPDGTRAIKDATVVGVRTTINY